MNIQTRFSRMTESELAASLNSRSWKYYSPAVRLELLQEVEVRQARKQGREALIVKTFQNQRGQGCLLGYFTTEGDSLYLNENYILNKQSALHDYSVAAAMATLMHEGRHAYQYAVACGRCPAPDEETRQRWRLNYAAYNEYTGDSTDQMLYVQQSLESDARAYALREVERFHQEVRRATGCDDFVYQKTVNDMRRREEAYNELAKTILTRELLDEVDRRTRELFRERYPGEEVPELSCFDEWRRRLARVQEVQFQEVRKYASYDATLDQLMKSLAERAAAEAGCDAHERARFVERRGLSCVL